MPDLRPSPRRLVVAVATLLMGASVVTAGAAAAAPDRPTTAVLTERGTLLEVVADDFDHGHARTGYGLERSDETFVALEGLSAQEARGLVGKHVRVTGRALGHDRLSATEVAVTASGEESVAAAGETGAATTYKKVAVILVNFTDDTRQPTTPEAMRNRMFGATGSVDAYYQDATDGALGVSGDVFGWLSVTRASASTCDYSAWGNTARSAATDAGADLSRYDHVMYLWPQQSTCSWAGLGQLPGSTSWINGTTTLRTTSHELGHNFGEHHASAARCTEGGATVAIPSAQGSCTPGGVRRSVHGHGRLQHVPAHGLRPRAPGLPVARHDGGRTGG